jgi:hypothetical protein
MATSPFNKRTHGQIERASAVIVAGVSGHRFSEHSQALDPVR